MSVSAAADSGVRARQWALKYHASDAAGDRWLFAVERLEKTIPDISDKAFRANPIRTGNQYAKLIPAKPSNDVGAADGLRQCARDKF